MEPTANGLPSVWLTDLLNELEDLRVRVSTHEHREKRLAQYAHRIKHGGAWIHADRITDILKESAGS